MRFRDALSATATALLISAFSSQAMAANKPLNGKYKCTGTATQSVLIGNVGGGSQSARIKAEMKAARGAFLIGVTTPGWKALIDGYFNPDLQKMVLSQANETYKIMILKDCSVTAMRQKGTGSQNKNGKKVSFSIEQSYSCSFSTSRRVDQYELTCKR